MNKNKDNLKPSSGAFFDLTPIITEITNHMVQGVSFLISESTKLLGRGIVKFVSWIFELNSKSKRKAISEEAIYKKNITLDKDSFGLDLNTKKKVKFTSIPFQRHSLILGGTGFGKSTAINNIIDYNLQNGSPIFLFDPKGNKSAIIEFASLCEYYQKKPIVFSETSFGNARFNPLKNLNDSQMSTLIENAFEWSDGEARYYRDTTISIITNKVYDEIRKSGKIISLPEIFRHMQEFHNGKETSGFLSQLSILMKSPFAKLLEDRDGDALSLMDVIRDKKCAYFGLSVMGYGAISRTLGKLFLGEIQIHTHELGLLYDDNSMGSKNPITVIIDEAGSLYFKDLINLQNKGRSSGIQLILATQTMADFMQIDPILVRQIFINTGCFFTFAQSNNEDAEVIAKTIGTYKTTKETNVTDDGEETEKGSVRDVREYYVHPEVIKNLRVGQCVLFTKDPVQNFLLAVRNSNELPAIKFAREFNVKNNTELGTQVSQNKVATLKGKSASAPKIASTRSFKINSFIKEDRIKSENKEVNQ